jgi:hypothetical protein
VAVAASESVAVNGRLPLGVETCVAEGVDMMELDGDGCLLAVAVGGTLFEPVSRREADDVGAFEEDGVSSTVAVAVTAIDDVGDCSPLSLAVRTPEPDAVRIAEADVEGGALLDAVGGGDDVTVAVADSMAATVSVLDSVAELEVVAACDSVAVCCAVSDGVGGTVPD